MSYLQHHELQIPVLRAAYRQGAFPMAEGTGVNDSIHWYCPDPRTILYPQEFHVSKRLARLLRQESFEIAWNDDFRAVMTECGKREEGSWINQPLVDAYTAWARAGEAFCLSVFRDGVRVGGIYGVQCGGVFMAESMFSRVSNASSVALVILVAGLAKAGIELIDLQYGNPHTDQFGPKDISHDDYIIELRRLENKAVELKTDYFCFAATISFVQSLIQTS
jgi:leucyl/phenylalanyl-tRNA--protein transferase